MQIDLSSYQGLCACGRIHTLLTKEVVIERGASRQMNRVADTYLSGQGKGCLVCDGNTQIYALALQEAMGERLHASAPVVTLPAQGLHADEKAVALLEERLPGDAGWLVAVGSGTIHDATRYVANDRSIHFISYPTAASVDGFVSTVSAMTWYGFKKTMPGVAPMAVVADTDIFSKAPYYLTAAGIGDVLGKFTSLLDWQASDYLLGGGFCEMASSLTREATDQVLENMQAIHAGDAAACEKLMAALLMSGISMQIWGNSSSASGAEHHMSHLWEMEVINPHVDALHGEKVGVGFLLVMPVYAKIGAITDLSARLLPYKGLPLDLLKERFGSLYEDVLRENEPDLLAEIKPEVLMERFADIQKLIRTLPDPEQIRNAMKAAGCKTTMEELGLDPSLLEDSLILSPFVRRRLTLMRVSKLIAL